MARVASKFDKKPSAEELALARDKPPGIVKDPRGPGLEAQSEFGAEVITTLDKSTPPITVADQPVDEFTTQLRKSGTHLPQVENLFEKRTLKPLFKEEAQYTGPDKSVAANGALSESVGLRDPAGYPARRDLNKQGTVLDAGLEAINSLLQQQGIPATDIFTKEKFLQLSHEEQVQVTTNELNRTSRKNAQPRQYAMISAMTSGYGSMPIEEFDRFYAEVDPSQIIDRMHFDNRMARQQGRRDVNASVAAGGWANPLEALREIAIGDLTPIWPLLTRWGLNEMIQDASGIEGVNGFWLGSARQRFREALVDMSPDEFNLAAKNIGDYLEKAQRDPIKGPLISKYNVMEWYEAVFTEDVMDGVSAKNKGDLYLGNFETFIESVFSVLVVAKAGSGIVRVMTKGSEISASTAARASGHPELATRIEEDIASDQLSLDFNFLPDEAVTTQLPRPESLFRGQMDELSDGAKATVIKSERIADEMVDRSGSLTGLGITRTEKTVAVQKQIDELDINDSSHVHGRMSELAMKEDGSGYRMRVVVGESTDGGFHTIEDVMNEAKNLDPDTAHLNIMRVNGEGILEPVFDSAEDFARALTKGDVDTATAARILGSTGDLSKGPPPKPDESFYLVHDRETFWHPIDKDAFGAEAFQSGWFPRFLLSPNAKFGDEIYGDVLRSYMGEQSFIKDFNLLFDPYYKLGAKDKRFVQSVFEFSEDFGKNKGRAPDVADLMEQFPHMTPKQLDGMIALQTGFDTMHHLFDRRLYRQGISLNWKSARPKNSDMPLYHGKILDQGVAPNSSAYYDPVSQTMVKMNRAEIDDIYKQGGGVMELDVAIEVGTKQKATHILVNSDAYEIGDLSTRLLKYHPGWNARFYEDPYFIVKHTEGVEVNGAVRKGSGPTTEAIRTSGTAHEAADFMRKASFRNEQDGVVGETFEVVRANDIHQSDSNLFQKQSLQREGRLFWDERNADRLPDVNGNRAQLEDPVKSVERLVGQAARQLSHEDLLRTLKRAWKNDYGDLLNVKLLDEFDLNEISTRLGKLSRNKVDKEQVAKIVQAKELIDYFRLIEGTQSGVIPKLRSGALDIATTVNAWVAGGSKVSRIVDGVLLKQLSRNASALEKIAATMDPFKAARSVAFNVFLVFRPARQVLLQSSQIGYLAGLDPLYVASPKLFTDAYGLRRGLVALRKSGYDDGMSLKTFANKMGISEKEYRVLLREFDRSGIIDLVDVHSFSGGSARFRKTALPASESPLGTIGYKTRQYGTATRDWFQNIGFNFGERNNLTFTYNLAVRRAMKSKGVNSVLDLTKKDWDNIRVDASNLGLGMVKPNNFKYQQGGFGVATQFLSFSHKAMLGLLAQNPAISAKSAIKIAIGTYMLYGGHMFGARDLVVKAFEDLDIPEYDIGGGQTTTDLVAGGLIDTTFNMIGNMTIEEYQDVDFGFVAPGLDFPRFFDMSLRNLAEQPYKAVLGPFGNIASNTMTAFDFVDTIYRGEPDMDPATKFMQSAVVIGSAAFPVLNDQVKAYLGYKMGIWYSMSNEPLPLRTTMNGLLARGVLGARTREELAYYGTQSNWYEQEDVYKDTVNQVNKYLNTSISLFYDGKSSREDVKRAMVVVANLSEDLPEGSRIQFRRDVLNGIKQNDEHQPSLFKVIVDGALKNPRVDGVQSKNLIRDMDIPEAHKEHLYNLLDDAHATKKAHAEQLTEDTLNGN